MMSDSSKIVGLWRNASRECTCSHICHTLLLAYVPCICVIKRAGVLLASCTADFSAVETRSVPIYLY